ncbi:MAG: hypothetical protein A2202_01805 [Bdellovibrionales bacterium RIFOXYA1_FULL_36_14]|nr:MAG: hypothetical protein A2202_01805 [Bdellovibrionales bacterium RIFOXYA1_FULL_36_14]
MTNTLGREILRQKAINRPKRVFDRPQNNQNQFIKVSDYYGENVFDFRKCKTVSEKIKREMLSHAKQNKPIPREYVELVADACKDWAIGKGATHFCHWFHPLTGSSAEKHDGFLSFREDETPIERLSASQLIQGEPDASSFPHGGTRATFEARGYTIWDLTSPMFLSETINGKTLCIPTAFVSYKGDALDVKTPLLRSNNAISMEVTKFLNLIGEKEVSEITVTCGAEQEYFLMDKAFFFERPDLIMTGRTLFGKLTARNQQLSDHYFGSISERILSFMQELDHELYKIGIPSKTRHNEVAPGQFEVAQIFRDSNVASDNNQAMMALIKKVADNHNLVALLHEKPMSGINGSGKHLNWSMADNLGRNLLEPGNEVHSNLRFLAMCSVIVEAIYKHADVLRASIATHSNDHRLGGHEAPPSIMSVFLGDTLDKIFKSIMSGQTVEQIENNQFDLGANQLAHLLRDNTDRNRTSPFAFTGNRFEFRAVGSAQSIGFPLSILNAAVSSCFKDANAFIEKEISNGSKVDEVLLKVIKTRMEKAQNIVFNGDGYGIKWHEEAKQRGLSNLKTSADAYKFLKDDRSIDFLISSGVYKINEIKSRYNIMVERYNTYRTIEFNTFISLIDQFVIPATIEYKKKLIKVIKGYKDLALNNYSELKILEKLEALSAELFDESNKLKVELKGLPVCEEQKSFKIAHELMHQSIKMENLCNRIEEMVPDHLWKLPKYMDMLFVR